MDNLAQLRRLGLFDARVPRYTSYPTAPHFVGGVDADTVSGWIGSIPEGSNISLYLHVPFCRRLCWFCACRTQGSPSAAPVAAYVDTLKTELRHLATILPRGVRIGHLHWGGGTPTLLGPEMIADLARAIEDLAPLAPGAEFSVEIDPNEIDQPRTDALARAGMTRASIGVQDFDPLIQQTIGRPQTYQITKTAVDMLRATGIASLNVDILYGLPHQTRARIAESVELVLSLSPDRVALFGYAHVPWMAKRQTMIPTDTLPTPEERLNLFNTARQLFVWDGYDEIGIDHFARPGDRLQTAQRGGRLRRNFQGYTDDAMDVLIGVGASSISRYPQGYAQNDAATSRYQAAVRGGLVPIKRGHVFTRDDILRGRLIEMLMCDFAADLGRLATETGAAPTEIARLVDGVESAFPGIVQMRDDRLSILPNARPLTRIIARHFDGYEAPQTAYSSAV
ncbi:oxygen-independent coproporphyrinogen III oxidase [Anianabacter salinae]|uniref:oxygen-independent coproporphyrinogen III oxidase n=1 Tax=Anianabacter salinae TaxID=2851023 RepID=UPI00225E6050|nr:oxygen-independent coproporphyrinogen III oxidase [Anianabacter salinae]MBV0910852.1 oxygen-independent coproporphyrinogen III oxidase [Anianabacter salinae]